MWFMTFRTYEVWLRAQSILSKKITENKFVFAIYWKLHFQNTVYPDSQGLALKVLIIESLDNQES